MEGFLILGFQGSMACNQAFSIIWRYGLVRTSSNLLSQLVFRKLVITSIQFLSLYFSRSKHYVKLLRQPVVFKHRCSPFSSSLRLWSNWEFDYSIIVVVFVFLFFIFYFFYFIKIWKSDFHNCMLPLTVLSSGTTQYWFS